MEQVRVDRADHGTNAALVGHDTRRGAHDLGLACAVRIEIGLRHTRVLDRDLEGAQIELAHGLLVCPVHRVIGAVRLHLVQCEVLEGHKEAVVTRAARNRRSQLARQQRVLGVVLKDTTRER